MIKLVKIALTLGSRDRLVYHGSRADTVITHVWCSTADWIFTWSNSRLLSVVYRSTSCKWLLLFLLGYYCFVFLGMIVYTRKKNRQNQLHSKSYPSEKRGPTTLSIATLSIWRLYLPLKRTWPCDIYKKAKGHEDYLEEKRAKFWPSLNFFDDDVDGFKNGCFSKQEVTSIEAPFIHGTLTTHLRWYATETNHSNCLIFWILSIRIFASLLNWNLNVLYPFLMFVFTKAKMGPFPSPSLGNNPGLAFSPVSIASFQLPTKELSSNHCTNISFACAHLVFYMLNSIFRTTPFNATPTQTILLIKTKLLSFKVTLSFCTVEKKLIFLQIPFHGDSLFLNLYLTIFLLPSLFWCFSPPSFSQGPSSLTCDCGAVLLCQDRQAFGKTCAGAFVIMADGGRGGRANSVLLLLMFWSFGVWLPSWLPPW